MKAIHKNLTFKSNTVLTIGLLEAMVEKTDHWQQLFYHEYSDGIISGCEFEFDSEQKQFRLNPGIIKYNANIYLLNNVYCIATDELVEDTHYRLQIVKVEDSLIESNITHQQLECRVVRESQSDPLAMTIAKFKYQPNATYVPKSLVGYQYFALAEKSGAGKNNQPTLSPQLQKYCQQLIQQKSELDHFDFVLLAQLEQPCSIGMFEAYIKMKKVAVEFSLANLDQAIQITLQNVMQVGEYKQSSQSKKQKEEDNCFFI